MPYRALTKRVGNALRLTEVLQVLVRHGFSDLLERLGVPGRVLLSLHLASSPPGESRSLGARLRAAMTDLGPTFVKFGQILSTRPDIVGMNISQELGLLQDRVDSLPFDTMRTIIEEAIDGSIDQRFASFNTEPVAAASLSQVYRARLHTGGEVAVKAQRPNIRQVMIADLNLLRAMAEWAEEHLHEMGWLSATGMVAELERSILRELDFSIEARVIERFRQNHEDRPEVFIPRTYRDLSSSTVLTMDWIDGVRIDATSEYPARNSDPKTVAALGCDLLCRQVFVHNLFHADPHPGNILLTRNNRIAFLDYGMVGRLERSDVLAIAELLRAVFHEDSEACARAVLLFTVSDEMDEPERLRQELAEYITFEAQAIIGGGKVGRAIEEVVGVLRRNKLQLAPRFSLLLKALATIESTGRALDPSMDMLPIIRPYVERIVLDRFTAVHLIKDAREDIVQLLRIGREIPNDFRHLLHMLRRGRFHIHLEHEKLNHIAAVLDRASNRVTVGLVTGAIIVGSSLLISTGTGARHIGMVGYILAAFLGLALVISILRSKNY